MLCGSPDYNDKSVDVVTSLRGMDHSLLEQFADEVRRNWDDGELDFPVTAKGVRADDGGLKFHTQLDRQVAEKRRLEDPQANRHGLAVVPALRPIRSYGWRKPPTCQPSGKVLK